MKIMIFTEGTILMHKGAVGHTRKEIIEQTMSKDKSVKDYRSYFPIGNSVEKLTEWKRQGMTILYLTSRRINVEIDQIKNVLKKYKFPDGDLLFRKIGEEYEDVAERVIPDVLIEDDCESIGGKGEMTITNVKPEVKSKIKSIVVKEFGGIDHLPNKISELLKI